jgi:hypothetical protein
MNDYAQKWADKLANDDAGLVHSESYDYGENLYVTRYQNVKGRDALVPWYKEVKKYKFPPDFGSIAKLDEIGKCIRSLLAFAIQIVIDFM